MVFSIIPLPKGQFWQCSLASISMASRLKSSLKPDFQKEASYLLFDVIHNNFKERLSDFWRDIFTREVQTVGIDPFSMAS